MLTHLDAQTPALTPASFLRSENHEECQIAVLMDGKLPTTNRVVASQILVQLAASRGLESVCLVNNDEEAALALRLGAWKATQLKEVRA